MSGAPYRTLVHEGQRIHTAPYDLLIDEACDYMHNVHRPPTPGLHRPRYDLGPDRPVSFHPKQCAHNIINLCTWADESGDAASTEPLLREAVDQLLAHRIEQGDCSFFAYPFVHEELGKRLEPPWVCALGQAFVLGALVRLYRLRGEPEVLDLARRTFRSLARLRRCAGQDELWTTFVDAEGYLWFEEYPSAWDPQTRILNGHVYGIMGLYTYHRLEPSQDALMLMQAGIHTVQRYFAEFRRPGAVNRYSLISSSIPDYLPRRSVMQQAWLFHVTEDPTFERQWRAFGADMQAGVHDG